MTISFFYKIFLGQRKLYETFELQTTSTTFNDRNSNDLHEDLQEGSEISYLHTWAGRIVCALSNLEDYKECKVYLEYVHFSHVFDDSWSYHCILVWVEQVVVSGDLSVCHCLDVITGCEVHMWCHQQDYLLAMSKWLYLKSRECVRFIS